MALHSTITFLTLYLILLHSKVSADSAAVSNTTAAKYISGLTDDCIATQVHIAIGDSSTEMKVTWNTRSISFYSLVRYGTAPDMLDLKATGSATILLGIGLLPSIQYIHSVALKELTPRTKYYYSVGSDGCESKTFYFTTMPAGLDWSPYVIFFGDMGTDNAVSLPWLLKEFTDNQVNAFIHAGDFAYDLSDNNSETGNRFMARIEPIAAHVPYMTCPGNHDILGDFYEYKSRFNMPNYGKTKSMYYSWDMGRAHFISLCTEFYFFPYSNLTIHAAEQYYWLLGDLQKANENRDKRPWIIVCSHNPFYCSNDNTDNCRSAKNPVRIGIDTLSGPKFGLEEVFQQYKVDLYLCGHEHSYERLYPTVDGIVKTGNPAEPYLNPEALIQVIAGNAGNKEGIDRYPDPFNDPPAWSAFRSENYGFLRLKIFNATHLSSAYVSADEAGKEIDSITIAK